MYSLVAMASLASVALSTKVSILNGGGTFQISGLNSGYWKYLLTDGNLNIDDHWPYFYVKGAPKYEDIQLNGVVQSSGVLYWRPNPPQNDVQWEDTVSNFEKSVNEGKVSIAVNLGDGHYLLNLKTGKKTATGNRYGKYFVAPIGENVPNLAWKGFSRMQHIQNTPAVLEYKSEGKFAYWRAKIDGRAVELTQRKVAVAGDETEWTDAETTVTLGSHAFLNALMAPSITELSSAADKKLRMFALEREKGVSYASSKDGILKYAGPSSSAAGTIKLMTKTGKLLRFALSEFSDVDGQCDGWKKLYDSEYYTYGLVSAPESAVFGERVATRWSWDKVVEEHFEVVSESTDGKTWTKTKKEVDIAQFKGLNAVYHGPFKRDQIEKKLNPEEENQKAREAVRKENEVNPLINRSNVHSKTRKKYSPVMNSAKQADYGYDVYVREAAEDNLMKAREEMEIAKQLLRR